MRTTRFASSLHGVWTLACGVLGLGASALSGCGGGTCPPGTEMRGEGCVQLEDSSSPDSGRVDAGADAAALDTGTPSGDACSAADEIDLAGTDSNCDGVDGIRGAQLYVSPRGDDGNTGRFGSPVRSIRRAVSLAAGQPILVATGNYPEDGSMMFAGLGSSSLALHGGYDPMTWARTTTRSSVQVGSDGAELHLEANAVISRVEIEGQDATEDGASAYAMRVDGSSTLSLRDVRLHAGRGAAGLAGMTGGNGATAAAGVNGIGCAGLDSGACTSSAANPAVLAGTSCGDPTARGGNGGGSGLSGTSSAAGRSGGAAPAGSGSAGMAGRRGADGTASSGEGGVSGLRFVTSASGDGSSGGSGEGGGGGGGDTLARSIPCPAGARRSTTAAPGASGGSGGGGGCAGTGGGGGGGGGASISLLARDVTIASEASLFEAAGGGSGGAGGGGGTGSTGGNAGRGGPAVCNSTSGLVYAAAGDGAAGGNGGNGGHGAGGAGAPTIGIALVGSATAPDAARSTFMLASGGSGGASSGQRGPDGARGDVMPLAAR
jgi:hypothetical protein